MSTADLKLNVDMSLFVLSITYKFKLTLQLAATVAFRDETLCLVRNILGAKLHLHSFGSEEDSGNEYSGPR